MRLNVIALLVFCTLVCGVADRSHAAEETDRGWAVSWGGAFLDQALEVGLDAQGNVYVAGQIAPTSDLWSPKEQPPDTGIRRTDVFLSKFDREGNLQWTRTWGGQSFDEAYGLAVDAVGNAYVCGDFEYTVDFDPGEGVEERTSHQSVQYKQDAYLAKYDTNGEFQWVRTWGGDSMDQCHGAAIDVEGNVYVTGNVSGGTVEFDPGAGTAGFTLDTYGYGIILSFDPNGANRWIRYWAPNHEHAYSSCIEIDSQPSGGILVTGYFEKKVDFHPVPSEGDSDIRDANRKTGFLVKYTTDGDYRWVRTWGGGTYTMPRALAVDGEENIFVSGNACEGCDFDPGPGVAELPSSEKRSFVSKFDPDGEFLWVRANPCSGSHWGNAIAADGDGNVYLTGDLRGSTDFDPGTGADERTAKGDYDACVCKLDSDGRYQWAVIWGTDGGNSSGFGILTDEAGNVFVVGCLVGSIDFGESPEGGLRRSEGAYDAFLVKLGPDGKF